ncbi:MAG: 2-hydroxyacid dehydrogenase [Verrucomicrobiota bacterium]
MKIAVFSTKSYDEEFLAKANEAFGHEIKFLEPRLTIETLSLASGYPALCLFVNDVLTADMLERLSEAGTRIIALRCAGFNHIDLAAAQRHNIMVVRVPAYSPQAVAEHTLALILCLNRRITRAHARVRESNFSLAGLLGFDLSTRTVGVVGTGKIGLAVVKILAGFDCKILAYDLYPNKEVVKKGGTYVSFEELMAQSDIISLHCPLNPGTHHIINEESLAQIKTGAMLINTSRGGLIDTPSVIRSLKSGKLGYLGLDVYEEEGDLFFEDLSGAVLQDDVFARLLTFSNVIITAHQAFFTEQALGEIAHTTLQNITELETTGKCGNVVTTELLGAK